MSQKQIDQEEEKDSFEFKKTNGKQCTKPSEICYQRARSLFLDIEILLRKEIAAFKKYETTLCYQRIYFIPNVGTKIKLITTQTQIICTESSITCAFLNSLNVFSLFIFCLIHRQRTVTYSFVQ
ncbi:hypothetical protein DERF_015031 [Dermatophagoides farinae]|uniref:Uncharacterized protein n=1 Tax=Dermatophagoides farinae TaxID=6954 RepID=A0A922HNL3_DERFA|nr:hypothetical protein DERF_015031 [Dermatophagoides farinae]